MYKIELPQNATDWINSNIFGEYNRYWLSQQLNMLAAWKNCKDPALLVQLLKKTNQLTTELGLDIHIVALETPLVDGKKVYNLIEDKHHILIIDKIYSEHRLNCRFYQNKQTRIVQDATARHEGNDSPLLHAMFSVVSQFLGLSHASTCALAYAHEKGIYDLNVGQQAQLWQADKIRELIKTD